MLFDQLSCQLTATEEGVMIMRSPLYEGSEDFHWNRKLQKDRTSNYVITQLARQHRLHLTPTTAKPTDTIQKPVKLGVWWLYNTFGNLDASYFSNQHTHTVSWHLWPDDNMNTCAMSIWDNPSFCRQLDSSKWDMLALPSKPPPPQTTHFPQDSLGLLGFAVEWTAFDVSEYGVYVSATNIWNDRSLGLCMCQLSINDNWILTGSDWHVTDRGMIQFNMAPWIKQKLNLWGISLISPLFRGNLVRHFGSTVPQFLIRHRT